MSDLIFVPEPDLGIKRVTIAQDTLPPVTITNDKMYYFLRYRITSEDKNRQSHWSPIYRVIAPPVFDRLSDEEKLNINSFLRIDNSALTFGTMRTDWSLPESIKNIKEFDVYYRFSLAEQEMGEFIFGGTISSNSYAANVPTSNLDQFEIAVQIPTFPKIRFEDATIFAKSTDDPG